MGSERVAMAARLEGDGISLSLSLPFAFEKGAHYRGKYIARRRGASSNYPTMRLSRSLLAYSLSRCAKSEGETRARGVEE